MAESLLHSLKEFELCRVNSTRQVVQNGKSGKYASNIELKFHGLKCAGTTVNSSFYREASPNKQTSIQRNLEQECKVLSGLRHPNIVQFIGVTHDESHPLPIIVTELLSATLHATLQKDSVLSEDTLKYSILDDVATGLCYLHEHTPNSITHGSLTTNNILLTSNMVAKISYLGDLSKLPHSTLLQPPATVDISAFGMLAIEVFREKDNQQQQNNAHQDSMLHLISTQHPLRNLIEQCLNNDTNSTLKASEILDTIHKVRIHGKNPRIEGPGDWQQLVSTIHQLQLDRQAMIEEHRHTAGVASIHTKLAKIESTELSELRAKNAFLEKQIAILTQDVESKTVALTAKDRALLQLTDKQNNLTMEVQDMQKTLNIKEEEVALKDELISITKKKCKRYRDLTATISNDMPHPLNMKWKLMWKDGAELPFGITAPQHVVMSSDLYVGGGQTDSTDSKHTILHYNADSNTWDKLPPSPFMHFGLGQFAGKLVTVGGSSEDSDATVTKEVMEYNPDSKEWVKVIADMPTPRRRACVVSHKSTLAVCGGIGRDGKATAMVEVFSQKQWHKACALPQPRCALGVTVKDNRAYFAGGYFPDLRKWQDAKSDCPSVDLSSLLTDQNANWNTTLAPLPVTCTTLVNHYGTLMAIGGLDADNKTSFSVAYTVYAYNASMNSWVLVDNLPFERSSMMVASLYNNIIVVGGWENDKRSTSVKIGTYNMC